MDKQEFINRVLLKISSTKFWAFLGVFIMSVMVLFGADKESQNQIYAMIIALGDLIVYCTANVAQKKVTKDRKAD